MQTLETGEIRVADAAMHLRISRERVIRLIQTGRIRGRRDPRYGWIANQKSVTEFTKVRQTER